METGKKPIPNRLRLHRKRFGYTQVHVAKLLKLHDSVPVYQWEKGMSLPSTINLIKLSAIYRTYPNELYPHLFKHQLEAIKKRELQVIEK